MEASYTDISICSNVESIIDVTMSENFDNSFPFPELPEDMRKIIISKEPHLWIQVSSSIHKFAILQFARNISYGDRRIQYMNGMLHSKRKLSELEIEFAKSVISTTPVITLRNPANIIYHHIDEVMSHYTKNLTKDGLVSTLILRLAFYNSTYLRYLLFMFPILREKAIDIVKHTSPNQMEMNFQTLGISDGKERAISLEVIESIIASILHVIQTFDVDRLEIRWLENSYAHGRFLSHYVPIMYTKLGDKFQEVDLVLSAIIYHIRSGNHTEALHLVENFTHMDIFDVDSVSNIINYGDDIDDVDDVCIRRNYNNDVFQEIISIVCGSISPKTVQKILRNYLMAFISGAMSHKVDVLVCLAKLPYIRFEDDDLMLICLLRNINSKTGNAFGVSKFRVNLQFLIRYEDTGVYTELIKIIRSSSHVNQELFEKMYAFHEHIVIERSY